MTGDGAVVREWGGIDYAGIAERVLARRDPDSKNGNTEAECLAFGIRQQAAEIERLTGERGEARVDSEHGAEVVVADICRRLLSDEISDDEMPINLDDIARAYLAQAAAIERLNDKLIEWQKEWYGWRKRLEASEACAADLLKAAEEVVESLALGPLDMAAKHGPDVSPEQIQNYALDTLAAAIAAAKGGTV